MDRKKLSRGVQLTHKITRLRDEIMEIRKAKKLIDLQVTGLPEHKQGVGWDAQGSREVMDPRWLHNLPNLLQKDLDAQIAEREQEIERINKEIEAL